jgi:hypothetical protein
MDSTYVVEVTPENMNTEGLFCVKDTSSPGFASKSHWYKRMHADGGRISILKNSMNKPIAFIEYIPGRHAWRPIDANQYLFIQCMFVFANNDKGKGYGSLLLKHCEEYAKSIGALGLCTMTSDGAWISDHRLFLNNGFRLLDKKERYELMAKKFNPEYPDPQLYDWISQRSKYEGWHLVYANQCPWHEKSVQAIRRTSDEFGIELQITQLQTSDQAKEAPSGFGVFSLLKDGKLLEDHYISETRFRNILAKILPGS